MTSSRLVHRITDSLPNSAWQIMLAGFREKKTYRHIAIDLAKAGFHVAERTIARRSLELRAEQLRRELVRVVGTEAATSDLLEEVVHLVEVLDVRPEWALRARRRVQKAVAEFFNNPSAEQARAVKLELARFRLESFTANARAVDETARLAGDQEPGEKETAGGTGGGHNDGSGFSD